MFSIPIIRQDLRINYKRILMLFSMEIVSMLLAIGICAMKLMEVSDIFWDTIPVIVIPMFIMMSLSYEAVCRRKEDGTMDFILATGMKPVKVLRTKFLFVLGVGVICLLTSMLLGCLTKVYSLTGQWSQKSYCMLILGAVVLQFMIGNYCFYIACRAKNFLSYVKFAVLIPIAMYIIYVVWYWSPDLFFLQFLSVFSLYRQQWYADGSWIAAAGCGIFFVLGVLFRFLGEKAFFEMNPAEFYRTSDTSKALKLINRLRGRESQ